MDHKIINNKSCHLRDRDIFFRAALKTFRRLTRNIRQKIKNEQGKIDIQVRVQEMQHYLENAIYHASMPGKSVPRPDPDSSFNAEDQVISDFLLTFNAACNNVNYLISHNLQLQKLEMKEGEHTPQFREYIKRMQALDEESLLKFIDQLKKRIHFFNKTMKIQK